MTSPIDSPISKSPKLLEENMQNVIKSTEDIINDDFEKLKISDSPYQDYSWSPNYASSPAIFTPTQERRSFDSLSHSRHSHHGSYSGFSPTQDSIPFAAPERLQKRHSEKLTKPTSESKLSQQILETIKLYQKNTQTAVLKLNVMGPPEYELEEKDIVNLFSRFGRILKIFLLKHRNAYIILDDVVNALAAQKSLNKCYLKDMNVTLYVNFCPNIEEDLAFLDGRMDPGLSLLHKQFSNSSDKENDGVPRQPKGTVFTFNQDTQFLPNTTAKFTCKYEIQIENEKEFRVAQKIIGSRGYNMKRIIEICQNQVRNQNISCKGDFLKLRLRGKGSGFKEGPDQKESEEPIHLCVSSRYNDVFETACKLVEELLLYVYTEYETFCKVIGRKGTFPLQIKKIEGYCGSNTDRQMPEGVDMFNYGNEFGNYKLPNNSTPFYPNENFFNQPSTPSPRNNGFVANSFRQFGQERPVNCMNEGRSTQMFYNPNQLQTPYMSFN